MTHIPIYDDTAPIACTASNEEIAIRIETVERMRSSLRSIERTEQGVRLHFPADAATRADVQQFTVDEKACCQFWGFEVHDTVDGISLRWDGPPRVTQFFDELVAFFESDKPLTAFSLL